MTAISALPFLIVDRLLTLIIVSVAVLMLALGQAQAEAPILSAPEAADKMQSNDMIVLDIRSPQEWAQTGVAKGAWPVSMHQADFGQRLNVILQNYRPDQIAMICATGGRTAYIIDILAKNNISGVADVSEGMMGNPKGPGWIARGMPVVSDKVAKAAYETATKAWK
ncbi:rhodanese-like domain-containing protein [Algirhabdus cladophorae]|uniref:rhodanese-like domain-containing protein n=1 Tax=Algirhabdus cladophorae TaxID=3377108 RepID=UPI003B848645